MSVGTNIRALREQFGLTQDELADKLGVTRESVHRWETDKIAIRARHVAKMVELFGIDPEDIKSEKYGLSGPARGAATLPADAIQPKPSGTLVPLLGYAHMGDPMDEGNLDELVEIPTPVAERHPRGFLVHAQGDCMDNHFPTDALLLVDPDMEPVSGKPVLAETEDYGAVVRNYTRGVTHTLLTASSHSGEYPDIMAGPDDPPVVVKGRVVWYMGERDER